MGMQAKWTYICDNCGTTWIREATLNESNADGTWEHEKSDGYESWSSDDSAWGPGIPEGWLQVSYDEITKQHYLFFHNRECYKDWLRKKNRIDEITKFENAV